MSTTKVEPRKLLTPEETAERLRISQTTVNKLCRTGALPSFRVGGLWRVREDDLEALIAGIEKLPAVAR